MNSTAKSTKYEEEKEMLDFARFFFFKCAFHLFGINLTSRQTKARVNWWIVTTITTLNGLALYALLTNAIIPMINVIFGGHNYLANSFLVIYMLTFKFALLVTMSMLYIHMCFTFDNVIGHLNLVNAFLSNTNVQWDAQTIILIDKVFGVFVMLVVVAFVKHDICKVLLSGITPSLFYLIDHLMFYVYSKLFYWCNLCIVVLHCQLLIACFKSFEKSTLQNYSLSGHCKMHQQLCQLVCKTSSILRFNIFFLVAYNVITMCVDMPILVCTVDYNNNWAILQMITMFLQTCLLFAIPVIYCAEVNDQVQSLMCDHTAEIHAKMGTKCVTKEQMEFLLYIKSFDIKPIAITMPCYGIITKDLLLKVADAATKYALFTYKQVKQENSWNC